MTTTPTLFEDEILGAFGTTMASRGREYAQDGRVLSHTFSGDTLSGRISGTENYTTKVRLGFSGYNDEWHIEDSVCSCPVGSFCKHGAALCYTLTQATDLETSTDGSTSVATLSDPPQWRTVLEELIPQPQFDDDVHDLALGVELFSRQPEGNSWASRYITTWAPATVQDLEAGRELSVRLRVLRSGSRGTWIKGGISWATFDNAVAASAHRFPPEQVRALHAINQFYSSTISGLGAKDLVNLSMVTMTQFWDGIRQAQDAGVSLVGWEHVGEVTLTKTGTLQLSVSPAPGESADLHLSTETVVEGEVAAAHGSLGVIGFYEVWHNPETELIDLRLTPARTPLAHTVREMVDQRTVMRIPAADTAEFFSSYYPKLSAVIPVVSSELELPEIPPAQLHIVAQFGAQDTLKLSARWRYEGAEDQTEHMARVLTGARQYWPDAGTGTYSYTRAQAAQLTDQALPALAAMAHVKVISHGEQPDYAELTGEAHVAISATPSAQRDWFDLGFQISIGEVSVPFSAVFTALARGENAVLLPNKTYFALDHSAFDELKELIDEATELEEWDPEAPQISRFNTEVLSYAQEIADTWEVDPRVTQWLSHLEELKTLTLPEATVPETVRAELRPYQVDGFRWLAQLYALKLGGILADDMGLGKTLQTLALIDYVRPENPFLVIAPASVVSVWKAEAERFVPHLQVAVLDSGTARTAPALAQHLAEADIIVTSYAIARIDGDLFAQHEFGGIILDEAQFVKNHRTKAHRAIREFNAPFWLAITGTPMENSLGDLWSIFNLTVPGLFGSYTFFRDNYQKPIEAGQRINRENSGAPRTGEKADTRMRKLRSRIRPLMLRRTKDVVAQDLPDKREQTLRVTLNPVHRRLYDQVLQRERKKVLRLVQDFDANRMNVFRSLTLLRMLALDPHIVNEDYAHVPSSKLEDLLSRLEEIVGIAGENHRVIIFSQFTSFLKRVSAHLEHRNIRHSYLDGATRKREQVISQFRTEDVPVFLISLKAGGFGLTLTEADYVFLLDPWWNPAAEAQAVDRAHRIGQQRNVMVYRMVAAGTIEEKVVELQQAKAELFSSLTEDDTAFSSALRPEDILALFDENPHQNLDEALEPGQENQV